MVEKYDLDLIINSLGRGGAERVCVTLANELAINGFKVRVITLRNVKNNYEADLNNNVVLKHLNAPKDLIGLIYLYKILKKSTIKEIIAFDERITSICNYVKIKKKKKYKVISRVVNNVDYQEKENNKFIYKIMYKFSKKFFKYSDKYIFQCKNMMNRMIKYFELDEKKSEFHYIYNPLSNSFSDVKIDIMKDNYYLMVGRLDKQKGYEYVIEALKKCKKKGKDIHLIILGDGPLKNKIQEDIDKYKLKIELLGNVKNVIDYYIKAKALLLTSIYEGFPNVILEAISCGCPVISFDCPTGPSEIIEENNGILIDYLDTDKLSDTLLKFDNYKWDYNKVKFSSKKYAKDIIINQYIKVIKGGKNEK